MERPHREGDFWIKTWKKWRRELWVFQKQKYPTHPRRRCPLGPNNSFWQKWPKSFCRAVHHLVSCPLSHFLAMGFFFFLQSLQTRAFLQKCQKRQSLFSVRNGSFNMRENGIIGCPPSLGIRSISRKNVVRLLTGRFVEQFISAWIHRIGRGEPTY